MASPRNYSSQSYSPGSAGSSRSVPTAVDATGKHKEKDDMVGLNDKFVRLIDKVKDLEDENLKLKTKLRILREYEEYKGKVDDIVKNEKSELEQQIENLLRDQDKLQAELDHNLEDKEFTKKSYEEERKIKDELENNFVITKQDVDKNQLETIQLALNLEDLMGRLNFLRLGFDEEIKELESQIQNKQVVLPTSSKRSLDMEDYVESVKVQYANMATRSREEAERWYKSKMDDMVLKAEQHEQEVRDINRDIADLVRQIQRLSGELEALRRKEGSLQKDIGDVRTEGEGNLDHARAQIGQLEEALRQAKQDLVGLVREHQELMNIKLALDIEIATYRKLLEGEEERIQDFMPQQLDPRLASQQHPPEKPHSPPKPENPRAPHPTDVSPTALSPPDSQIPDVTPLPKKRLLIRVQVESGRVVSESSHYTED